MSEKTLELKLKKAVKAMGGLAIKFFSFFFTGMPDRMVLMPGGRIWFVELKSPGEKPNGRQPLVIRLLTELGFKVRVVSTDKELSELLNEIAA